MTTEINETLSERGNRYGAFSEHARIAQGMKRVMESGPSFNKLSDSARQSLEVILDKVARIVNGDPAYLDNWHDIQGYAKLEEDILRKTQHKDEILNALYVKPIAPVGKHFAIGDLVMTPTGKGYIVAAHSNPKSIVSPFRRWWVCMSDDKAHLFHENYLLPTVK